MGQRAVRSEVRDVVRRALIRALLVLGGAVGGTLVGWAITAGTAQADPLVAPPGSLGGVIAPVTSDAAQIGADPGRITGPLVAPDGVRPLTDAADPATLLGGVPRVADVRQVLAPGAVLPAATVVLGPLGEPVRTASADLGTVIAPARADLPMLPGVLQPGRGAAPSAGTAGSGESGAVAPDTLPPGDVLPAGAPEAALSAAALTPAGPAVGEPAAQRSVRTGHRGHLAGRDGPEPRAPGQFPPLPGAPAPSTATGQSGATGDAGWSAEPFRGSRGNVDGLLARPRQVGTGHRAGTSAQQPGVTPD